MDDFFDADFSSQHEHHFPRHNLWRHLRHRHAVLGGGRDPALPLCDLRWSGPASARSLQSSTPRWRTRHRLPLLPYFGGSFELCRHSSHSNLHELSCADLDRRPHARTCPRNTSCLTWLILSVVLSVTDIDAIAKPQFTG